MSEEQTEKKDGLGTRVSIDRSAVPKAPSFVDLYANDTYIQLTPWDVRLMFAVLTELGPNQNAPSPLRIADVRMSLHHAKRVSQILAEQIARYEQANGELTVPGQNKNAQ